MKKIIFSSALFLVTLVVFYACNRSETSPDPHDLAQIAPVPKVLQGASIAGLRLPDGTRTKVVNGGSTVEFYYPEGVIFVDPDATSSGAELLSDGLGRGSYTCTGDCSSGCDVYYVDKQFGCSACSNGNSCTGKASRLSAEGRGGFLDTRAGLKFLSDKKEADALYLKAPDNLFEIPMVRKAMMEMNKQVFGVAEPQLTDQEKSQLKMVAVNLFGTLVTYGVPDSYLRNSLSNGRVVAILSLDGEGKGATCKCESGSTGCKKKETFTYTKCESGECTSCTMTVN